MPLTLDDLRTSPIFFNSRFYEYDELRTFLLDFINGNGRLPRHGEPTGVLAFLVEIGLAGSNSEARRLVQGNAVSMDGVKIVDVHTIVVPYPDQVVRVGKRKYIRIKIV